MQSQNEINRENKNPFKRLVLEIFARIWAVWGIVSFIATFLIILIPSLLTYLLPAYSGQIIFIKIARVWMNVWLTLIGCFLKIKGRNNFIQGKTYVVTFNHNTLLDVPLSCPFIPGANKTIAKKSFAKVPLFGWFYKKGSVLVDRNSDSSRRKSYEEMKKVLQLGMHMCLYPEGTRNRTHQPLKPFHDGAFRLAVETKHDVIPALLFNTNKAMPNNKLFYLLPYTLEMHFLPAVSSKNISAKELKEKVFTEMWNYYESHQ
jgi:1-acyl-sn-glycerol-3-phosphate acyltransferase